MGGRESYKKADIAIFPTSKKKCVLLVGAGELGSRYLQGLSGLSEEVDVIVYDHSQKSLDLAKSRWAEVNIGKHLKYPIFINSHIPEQAVIDLVIVSTTATDRAALVRQIAQKSSVRFWILEKVLAQSLKDLDIIENSLKCSEGAWVNTSRRVMKWHQTLQKRIENQGPLKACRMGQDWGLACNSIHYLDLLEWWTGERLLSIDTTCLNDIWQQSKRSGFFEISGVLIGKYSNGTTLRLEACLEHREEILEVEFGDGQKMSMDESAGVAQLADGTIVTGKVELQSDLIGPVVESIFQKGDCDLTKLAISLQQHRVLVSALLTHWNLSSSSKDIGVPIT